MNYLDGYLAWLAHERRLSALTVEGYARDVRQLFALIGEMPLADIQSQHIRRFIAQLHGRGLGSRTLARLLSAWRGFFQYLTRDHGWQHNPCIGLRAPKQAKLLPEALSPEQAAQLMQVPEDDGLLAVRDKAIIELFYSSGLRLSELTGLDPEGVDFSDGTVRVTGKGRKTRVVPMGAPAAAAIKEWLPLRAQLLAPGETALFVSQHGTRLTPRAVQYRLKYWAVKLGLPANVHPHVLRHSFASHVLQSSGDLRAVQEMLGHASIATTQIYTHLDFQHLAKVYDAAHPRAKKK